MGRVEDDRGVAPDWDDPYWRDPFWDDTPFGRFVLMAAGAVTVLGGACLAAAVVVALVLLDVL